MAKEQTFIDLLTHQYCPTARLVIELDEAVHNTPKVQLADTEREYVLSELGLYIMRFPNDEVFITSVVF